MIRVNGTNTSTSSGGSSEEHRKDDKKACEHVHDAVVLRSVSKSLTDRPFVLLFEQEETCPDSFMCPYRVGASVKYP